MAFPSLKDIRSRFDRIAGSLKKFFQQRGLNENYDLWKSMHDNEIGSERSTVKRNRLAIKWFKNTIMKDRTLHYKAKLMTSAQLYMFKYDDPKHKDTLAYFDTEPLVLMMGLKKRRTGMHEIGLNLHLLPPNVRKLVLYKIYLMYKAQYGKALKSGVQPEFQIKWEKVYNLTKSLGAGFALREYIPERRKDTVRFPMEEWERAIWVPSKGYAKITPIQLEKEWKKFLQQQKKSESNRLAGSDTFLQK